MIAAPTERARRDINFVLLRDGRGIHLDAIATAAEGQSVLDDLDCAILTIRAQIEAGEAEARPWHWRRSARLALDKKRNIRPRLQQRIAELRRAERQAAAHPPPGPGPARRDARRKAFINAAKELLSPEVFTEVWSRAAEVDPAAFAETVGGAQ